MAANKYNQLSRLKGLLQRDGVSGVYQKIQASGPVVEALFPGNPMAPKHYSDWIERHESALSPPTIKQGPQLSILMPVYAPDHDFLDAAIGSILGQSYANWELCIHVDGSCDSRLERYLSEQQHRDDRIKYTLGTENRGIAHASNQAAKLANGDFVVLMDQDDCLSSFALAYIAQSIADDPDTKLIYSDEDKLNASGTRESPYFKPEFNYQLLLSQNYFCHLVAINRSVFLTVEGFRTGFDGAQDHDLILRVIEQINPRQIHHIPRVLYHWRMHEQSTAADISSKPRALEAGRSAVADHLGRKSVSAQVEVTGVRYRVTYDTPGEASVTIIIPTRNGVATLARCVESIRNLTSYSNYDIMIVDNGSDDYKTLQYLKLLSEEGIDVVVANQPFNFSALNNLAFTKANSDFVCLLNDDTEVITPGWLTEMLGHASQAKVGAVGAKLLYPNDTIQHAGVILGIGGVAGHGHKHFARPADGYFSRLQVSQNLSAVTAACMLIKTSIWQEVGGLDEALAVAFNDIDFCLRLADAGYSIVWTPWAELYHHESISRGYEDTPEKQQRFTDEVDVMRARWGKQLAEDPHYSPHLTLKNESFMLRKPSEY